MSRFKDKIVVISGVSSGIGRTTTKMFVKEGAKVVGIARRKELLAELEAEIAAEGGVFIPYCGDITKSEDIDGVIALAGEKFGRIDILVNNAGALDYATPVADMLDDMWDRCVATNLTAPMKMMRGAMKYMLNQESGGCIVNIGSVAALRGAINGAGYTSTKHGLIGLTKNTAYTYAKQGIRCNIICPGGVDTYMCSDKMRDETWALNPNTYPTYLKVNGTMVRRSQPEEIANLVLFVCSEEASVLNGAIIAADSGFTAS